MSKKKVCDCTKPGDALSPLMISVGNCATCGAKNVSPDKRNLEIVLCPHNNKSGNTDPGNEQGGTGKETTCILNNAIEPNKFPKCNDCKESKCSISETISRLLSKKNDRPKLKLGSGSALPIVCPRYQGSGCALEISVLEKHENKCPFKKGPNPGRRPEDRVGDYEVVGRLVYKTCGPKQQKTDVDVDVAQATNFEDFSNIFSTERQIRSQFPIETNDVSSQTKTAYGVANVGIQTPLLIIDAAVKTEKGEPFYKNVSKVAKTNRNVHKKYDGHFNDAEDVFSCSGDEKDDDIENTSCHELPMKKIDVTKQKIRVYGDTIIWNT